MRVDVIQIVFLKELREVLRDRRSLLIMFGVPLLLYPLLTLGIAGLGMQQQQNLKQAVARVVLLNGEAAPRLAEMFRADGGFELSTPTDPQAVLRSDAVDGIVQVPPGAEARLLDHGERFANTPGAERSQAPDSASGDRGGNADGLPASPLTPQPTTAPATRSSTMPAGPEFVVSVNRGRFRAASSVQGKIDRVLDKYERWVIEQRLARRDVEPGVLAPLRTRTVDVATGEQRLGSLMASALPLFLLLTGMLGAFFPALNATTTERERGTLESLLATPAARTEILLGKGLLVLIASLLTAGLNMGSMALVLWRLFSAAGSTGGAGGGGSLLRDLSVSPAALGLTYLAAVPTLIFFVGLVLIVGLLARTFQEANSLAVPIVMLPVASALVGILDPPTSVKLLLTPIANTTVIIRDVLTGRASAGAFLLAFASSCLYAGLLLSAAARLFGTEQLVNPAWEPLSFKGLGKRSAQRRPRLPSVEEALSLMAVTVLLSLYIQPSLLQLRNGLLWVVTVGIAAPILLPTLLLAWRAGYPFVQTFSLRRPGVRAMIGATLLGVGIVPLVNLLSLLLQKLWPSSGESQRALLEYLVPTLRAHPILTPLAIGLFAGVCEEFFYRGPLQTALLRRLKPGVAITIGALLFAAAHMDLHGLPIRTLLGMLLGYVVYRGGSIFPAIVIHAVYDAAQVGLVAWEVRAHRVQDVAGLLARVGGPIGADFYIHVAGGITLSIIGAWMLRVAWPRRQDVSDIVER